MNLVSQIALNDYSLIGNETTRDQVDPAQARGWNIATNDAPILYKVRGKDQTRNFTSEGQIDPTRV